MLTIHHITKTHLFYNWKFVPFGYLYPTPPTGHHQSVLCICELFFKIPYVSEIIQYLYFSDLFHLAQIP